MIPLSIDVDIQAFHATLRGQSHEWTQTSYRAAPHRVTVSYNCKSQKCGYTFISDPTVFSQTRESTMNLLDTLSVCDSILLLADYDEKSMTHPLVDPVSKHITQVRSA